MRSGAASQSSLELPVDTKLSDVLTQDTKRNRQDSNEQPFASASAALALHQSMSISEHQGRSSSSVDGDGKGQTRGLVWNGVLIVL